jgi:hypothetical protein
VVQVSTVELLLRAGLICLAVFVWGMAIKAIVRKARGGW